MPKANQAAFDVGQLSQKLADGYNAYTAALMVASDPRAINLAPQTLPGQIVPIKTVLRNDGTFHAFHFTHYLGIGATDPVLLEHRDRVWLSGALITLGDQLAQYNYFDRAPELELVRHLRNGIAHGNRFRIDNLASLLKYPAHNRLAWVRGDKKTLFEITPSIQGQKVLFDYAGPGDILDVLMSVSLYLVRMGNGDPLRG